ncbi:MAG: citrate lyase subunit alpha [Candidatus Marinimicrobia bacterium CG08_land_8_20_14_0_20_45_22]|nr:MAG: citrate lyase subunit alpha [Candidatus Marinimicrobia bacterium CG08_land_8_20_14_0_20_45_22]
MSSNLVKNAAGRWVPTEVNGKPEIPFKGIGKHRPEGRKYAPKIPTSLDYPADGNKLLPDLKTALIQCGLKDGMTISTHHHLRNGDLIANQIFDIAHELGVKNLVWFPSASFPCHEPLIKYLEDGTIHHIEGSMNGPLGRFTSQGKMKGVGVLRSHGGRYQAVQDGEVQIDIAVLAAPTADSFGNAHGLTGPSACGCLGYALADYQYADKVIIVTDNLIPFPAIPMQIVGNYVDYVVKVDKIGIAEQIVSGTTQITKSPDRLLIAELTTKFCDAAGLIRDGFSFQMGAGGTSLAIGIYFHQILKERGIKARFAVGGSTQYSVKMIEDGCLEYLLDAQSFDLDAVRSMGRNPNHPDISIFHCYDYHAKGNYTTMMDVMILGATEVDVNFNGNVVTHSDGYLLHGIGGWQNCLAAKCTILPIPLFRDRIPVIRDEVTTLCGPGELIDVIVTERGIAINPLRTDLIDKVKNSGLPIKTIQQLKEEAERICGKPQDPVFDDQVVAVIKWVDGTIIDAVRKLRE